MDIRKILITLIFIVSFILAGLILMKLALQSEFSKINSKTFHGSDAGYKMKTKYYKELYYSTQFSRNPRNKNIVSLGNFTVNVNNSKNHNKLIMKVAIETEEDSIDDIMSRQSVIRNDVIDSIMNLRYSGINQESLSREIKTNLNKRLNGEVVKNVYFEKFLIQ